MENKTTVGAAAPSLARTSIGKRKRFEVFHRDGFTCQYCGKRPPEVVLEVDHIHPVAKGGDNDEMNLVTACEACNAGKTDRLLTERIIRPDADEKYLEAQQEIAEARRFLAVKAERDALAVQLIRALENVWYTFFDAGFPKDHVIKQMIETYPYDEVYEAIKIAGNRHRWKPIGHQPEILGYIWGILRRREREQQQ